MVIAPTDREWIIERARAAGFDLAGVAPVPQAGSLEEREAGEHFVAWIDAGYAAEMEWLKRTDETGELVRGSLRRALPWARSVLVCVMNYNATAPRSIDPAPADSGWIARYAWTGAQRRATETTGQVAGSDYHDVLLPKLRTIEAELRTRFGADCETRSYVDTGPLVEREYARWAGVGWIGKNTCVINQELGSWLLLGVIVTSLELANETWTLMAADHCGSCTRCIDACPTDALVAPRTLDASHCIAYLTIEKKGAIDEELRPLMGRQVFGCDICQDVCPWNRKAPVTAEAALPARGELVNPSLAWLASMDGPEFNRWFRGSPLERTRRKRVLRNVAIAMGNSGEQSFLLHLQEWAESEDTVLADAARWAMARIEGSNGPPSAPQ